MRSKYGFILTILLFSSFNIVNYRIFNLQTAALAQNIDELRQRADNLERQGITYLQSGQVNTTLQMWGQALDIYRQIGDRYQQGRLLSNFGQLYLQLQAYDRALQSLQESSLLLRDTDKKDLLESVYLNLGTANRRLNRPTEAARSYQQALALARELNDTDGKIQALGNLGDIYSDLKNYSLAAQLFQEIVVTAQKINNTNILSIGLKRLADTYYLLGNCEYARAFYEWGTEVTRPLNKPEQLLGFLQNGGNAAYCTGNMQLALNNYEQALKIARGLNREESIGELTGNIGLVNIHLKNYDRAIDYINQDLTIARKLGRKQAEGQALGMLGDAYYHRRDYNTALTNYQNSLNIARSVGYTRGVGLMLTNIGACLLQLNRLPDAETNLRQGIEVLKAYRLSGGGRQEDNLSLFDREVRTYRLLQEVLIKAGKIEPALEVAEAGRARIFLEFLAKQNKKADIKDFTVGDIKALAKRKNATLVEYSLVYDLDENKQKEAVLYIWTVKPGGEVGFKRVELGSKGIDLADRVNNSRSALGLGGRGLAVRATGIDGQRDSLRELYRILIGPIAAGLPAEPNGRVIFIPHEELFLVPFPALVGEDNRYLVEKLTPLTAPSLQALQFIGESRDLKQEKALIVGNPTMPTVKASPTDKPRPLAPLPGAEKEAREIAKILNTAVITGNDANKSNIVAKMADSDIIHLATHGLLDVDSDGTLNTKYAGYRVGGAIALAPRGDDSGLLTVDEIVNLKLKADLVVLSACDTAGGKLVGDGVIGLSRSFLSAGAKNIIVSLWAVPDAPTADLMDRFYLELQKNPDKARALRQAMLDTMKTNPQPRDWAAFTLIGG